MLLQQLLAHTRTPGFRAGMRDMLQVAPGIGAWGLVTGVAMVKSGLSVPLALLMGFTVFAGSAQLASLPLMAAGAPVWLILATAFCVNLRFVIFSAQMRTYFEHLPRKTRTWISYLLGDLTVVLFVRRYPVPPQEPAAREEMLQYYRGGCTTNWLSWQVPQTLGILLGAAIPTHWGLGFAGILALLGITLSLLQDKLTAATAIAAAVVAVVWVGLPLKLNLVLAIAVGMLLAMAWQAWIDDHTSGAPR
jgi:predicted branched-subunit amino acid permease